MSDIPDWLIELAAQRDEDDEEDEEPEWDFLRSEPEGEDEQATMGATRPVAESTEAAAPTAVEEEEEFDEEFGSFEESQQDEDVMEALRSQVEVDEAETLEPAEAVDPLLNLTIRGLQPWQQLVLAVLVLLDVVVIGMMLLVMLGRVSIP